MQVNPQTTERRRLEVGANSNGVRSECDTIVAQEGILEAKLRDVKTINPTAMTIKQCGMECETIESKQWVVKVTV